jgi:hypothetical protein
MTTPNDTPEPSLASASSQPEAWANQDDDGIYDVGLSEAHAHYVLERAANGNYSHRNPRIVPLYRQPQPAITDEERERVGVVADWAAEHLGQDDPGVVALRALMERLG